MTLGMCLILIENTLQGTGDMEVVYTPPLFNPHNINNSAYQHN